VFLAGIMGTEWRIDPEGNFRSGGAGSSSLFTTTPTVILQRGQWGRDLDLVGLALSSWEVSEDWWDQVTAVSVDDAAFSIASGYWSDGVAAWNAAGDPTDIRLYEISSTIDNQDDADKRAEQLASQNPARRVVRVTVSDQDPGRWLKPGDYVWAFDPINDLVDTGQATYYHGQHLTPAKLRLYGLRWGLSAGMGVYRLARDDTESTQIVDLTDFVEWEDADTTLEVDAQPRSALIPSGRG
jgi:hypothetical protein